MAHVVMTYLFIACIIIAYAAMAHLLHGAGRRPRSTASSRSPPRFSLRAASECAIGTRHNYISASPTAGPWREYGRAGTQNDRLAEPI